MCFDEGGTRRKDVSILSHASECVNERIVARVSYGSSSWAYVNVARIRTCQLDETDEILARH